MATKKRKTKEHLNAMTSSDSRQNRLHSAESFFRGCNGTVKFKQGGTVPLKKF